MPDRARVREPAAAEYIRRGEPLGWFEALYQEAESGDAAIPWADVEPNAWPGEFWKAHPLETTGKRAVVISAA